MEELELSADDIILHIENPQKSTPKVLEWILCGRRVPDLYTSTLLFLYDNNTQPEGETKKSFNSASKRKS